MTETEHHGIWWLVNRSDSVLHGTLRISRENSIALTLSGCFEDSSGEPPEGRFRILGRVGAGQEATLEACYVLSPGVALHGIPMASARQVWHVESALIGAHVSGAEAVAFHGCVVSVPGLTSWFARAKPFRNRFDVSLRSHIATAKRARSLPLWTSQDVTLRPLLITGSQHLTETTMRREWRIDLGVSAACAMSQSQLLRSTRPLQLLLSLSTGRPSWIFPRTATLSAAEGGQFASWHWRPHSVEDVPVGMEHAFGYEEWRALRARNLRRWLALTHKLTPVVDLYLVSLRELDVIELRFLTLVQALESYHRRTHRETLIEPKEWTVLRNRLVGTVRRFADARQRSKDWRMRIVQRFDHANELSLRSRLKQLLVECGSLAVRIAGGKPAEFASKIANTRNYLTHWLEASRTVSLKSTELAYASFRLQALLEVLMLRDLGFDLSSRAVQVVLRRRIEWM